MQNRTDIREIVNFVGICIFANILVWVSVFFSGYPYTIGLGPDSQSFTPAIHYLLRLNNSYFSPTTWFGEAREEIFSYPYFGILYPFYWTIGIGKELSYSTSIFLDFLSVVFHMVVGSIGYSLLLKKLKCSTIISIVFGIFIAYSLHMKMWSSWIWALAGYTWIPFGLIGSLEIIRYEKYKIGLIYMALAYGLIGLGSSLALVYCAILNAAFFWYLHFSSTPKDVLKKILLLFAGVFWGIIIAASHLIPTLYRSSEYIRWYEGGAIIGGLKPPYEGTLTSSIKSIYELCIQLISPQFWNNGLGHIYVSACVLTFFAYYAAKNIKSKSIILPFFLIIYFILDSLGDKTFIHRITYQIPLLGSVRYPVANTFIATTLIMIFSALGLNSYCRKIQEKGTSFLIIVAIACVSAAVLQISNSQNLLRPYAEKSYLFLLPATFALLTLLFYRSRHLKLIILSIFISQSLQNSMIAHPKLATNQIKYANCDELHAFLNKLEEQFKNTDNLNRLLIDSDPEGLTSESKCFNTVSKNPQFFQSLALFAGLNVTNMYLSPRSYKVFKTNAHYSRPTVIDNPTLLLQGGISHILTNREICQSEKCDHIRFIDKFEQFSLYEVKNYKLGMPTIGCIIEPQNDEAAFEFQTNLGTRQLANASNDVVDIDDCTYDNNNISIESTSSSVVKYSLKLEGITVFVSDQMYRKSWKAFVDNNKSKIYPIDKFRFAVILPGDAKTLELYHRPIDFLIGYVLTLLGFFAIVIFMIVNKFSR